MNNSRTNTRRQSWITTYRVATLALLVVLVTIGTVLLLRPVPEFPSAAKIASAVNGPSEFQRPSALTYVPATGSCVVGGTVTSTTWHDNTGKAIELNEQTVGTAKANNVEYTSFGFKSDQGREFEVSDGGALYTNPGQNLGLQLACDPRTMNTADSFGMVAIIWGGK